MVFWERIFVFVLLLTIINKDAAIGIELTGIFYGVPNGLNFINFKTSSHHAVIRSSGQTVAVDINLSASQVYWSDIDTNSIYRLTINTNLFETVVQNAGLSEGIAVDWVSDLLFWTNSDNKRIEVSHLDGTDRCIIIKNGLDMPRAIVSDPKSSFIFWTDYGVVPKIEKSTMSGGSRQIVVNTDIVYPNGLVIDHTSPGRLYWTDASSDQNYVQSVNLHGSDRQRFKRKSAVHPFGITVYNEDLYISDWLTGKIYVIKKKNGELNKTISTSEIGKQKTIMGLAMFDKSRQPEVSISVCGDSNGGCSHLCLPNPNGVKCSCPDGVHLEEDGRTCSKLKDFLIFAAQDVKTIYLIPTFTTTQIAQRVIFPSKHSIQSPVAVEYDNRDERLYWTDYGLRQIARAYVNGSGMQILHRGIAKPEGIAIDKVGRNIYWTDSSRQVIEVSKLNGTSRKVLIKGLSVRLRDVQVDSINGHIYWTEWADNPTISRANMDGSSKTILINTGIHFINALTIDYVNNLLYWIDAYYGRIESYNMGNNERKILNNDHHGWSQLNSYMNHSFGLTTDGDQIFWTDWAKGAVYAAKRTSGNNFRTLVAFLYKPLDIISSVGQTPDAFSSKVNCSHDYSIYNKDRYSLKTLSVKKPMLAKGLSSYSTVICSPDKILLSNYSVHTVTCTAWSRGGKTDSCSYRIWIKDHFCKLLAPPINGKVTCKARCNVACNQHFELAKNVTEVMTCVGERWKPHVNEKVNLLPVCLAIKPPKGIEIVSSFTMKKACDAVDKQKLESKFRIKLEEVVLKIEESDEVFTNVTIKEIKASCSEKTTWLSQGRSKTINLHFTLLLNSSRNEISSERIRNPERKKDAIKSILWKSVNAGLFTLSVDHTNIEAERDSYRGTEGAVCSRGEAKRSYYCVLCAVGMYANETSQDCEPCAIGYYQDKEGQTKCHRCPANTSTVVMGTGPRSGCYGGDDLLVNVEKKVEKCNIEIFKEVIASLVNEYCAVNICPTPTEDENLEGSGDLKRRLTITQSDVVIPLEYPVTLKNGYTLVRMFVVVSFNDYKLQTLPREKLEVILYRSKGQLNDKLASEMKSCKINKNEQGSVAKKIVMSFVGIVVGIAVFVIIFCFVKKCIKAPEGTHTGGQDNQNLTASSPTNSDAGAVNSGGMEPINSATSPDTATPLRGEDNDGYTIAVFQVASPTNSHAGTVNSGTANSGALSNPIYEEMRGNPRRASNGTPPALPPR